MDAGARGTIPGTIAATDAVTDGPAKYPGRQSHTAGSIATLDESDP